MTKSCLFCVWTPLLSLFVFSQIFPEAEIISGPIFYLEIRGVLAVATHILFLYNIAVPLVENIVLPKPLQFKITGIDGQSRTSDDLPDRPLRVRHEQKKAKYGPTADRHNPVSYTHLTLPTTPYM